MGTAARITPMSASDYLAWEKAQTERHEFVDGEAFAMAGAEDRHVRVAMNLGFALSQHLRGTPCRTFMSDMKVQVGGNYFYPDVVVTCSAADRDSALVKREPQLIIEVLSPATAGYDRGEKFARYRQIATLSEYVLIDLDTRGADVYRKGENGLWVLHPFDAGQTVRLAAVNLEITAEELFAEVEPSA